MALLAALTRSMLRRTNKQVVTATDKERAMSPNQSETYRKVTVTISCPLELYLWLRRTQRNMSAYVVRAVEDAKEKDSKAR